MHGLCGSISTQYAVAVVCWGRIYGLGWLEKGLLRVSEIRLNPAITWGLLEHTSPETSRRMCALGSAGMGFWRPASRGRQVAHLHLTLEELQGLLETTKEDRASSPT